MKQIDIEKYIPMYEKREIKVREIAIKEDSNKTTIDKLINKYYKEQGKVRPNFSGTIDIEKYIPILEKREITFEEIRKKENLSISTINKKVDEYYENIGKKRPKFTGGRRKVEIKNIEKYIEMYEERKITIRKIAEEEKTNSSVVERRIQEYYEKIGREKPRFKAEHKEIDMEQYINEFEEGKITVEEISNKEDISIDRIRKRIKKYYEKKGKKAPKIGISIELLIYFLTKGMTKEEIRKEALKRNTIIPDEYFRKAEEKISKEEEER